MSRQFTEHFTSEAGEYLTQLVNKRLSPQNYKEALYQLGYSLGTILSKEINNKNSYLVCTTEDADYLAKGIIEKNNNIHIACYWNKRSTVFKDNNITLETAPIVKKYEEPVNDSDYLIVLKSIISSGCVVKYNLLNIIEKINPVKIFIVAPVMFENADRELRNEFSHDVSNKFNFITFAIDNEKDSEGNVEPGIGGNIYQRLGFKDQDEKNNFIPLIVKTRRQLFI